MRSRDAVTEPSDLRELNYVSFVKSSVQECVRVHVFRRDNRFRLIKCVEFEDVSPLHVCACCIKRYMTLAKISKNSRY